MGRRDRCRSWRETVRIDAPNLRPQRISGRWSAAHGGTNAAESDELMRLPGSTARRIPQAARILDPGQTVRQWQTKAIVMRQDVAAELARVSKKTRHTSYEQTNTRLTHNNNAAEHRCSGWCVGNSNMRLALPWTSWRGRVSIERSKQRVDCRLGHATPRSTPVPVVDGLRRSAWNLECRCTHRMSPRERARVRHSACA